MFAVMLMEELNLRTVDIVSFSHCQRLKGNNMNSVCHDGFYEMGGGLRWKTKRGGHIMSELSLLELMFSVIRFPPLVLILHPNKLC